MEDLHLHTLFNAYFDLTIGHMFPHTLYCNPKWKPVFENTMQYGKFVGKTQTDDDLNHFFVQGAKVYFDESVPNFRFDDVKGAENAN